MLLERGAETRTSYFAYSASEDNYQAILQAMLPPNNHTKMRKVSMFASELSHVLLEPAHSCTLWTDLHEKTLSRSVPDEHGTSQTSIWHHPLSRSAMSQYAVAPITPAASQRAVTFDRL